MAWMFEGHHERGRLPVSETTLALDAVRERRRMLESRGGNYEASGKLWLKEISRQKENMKRQQEESRRRNAKLKEDAAAAAELHDAMRNDSASRVSKTQAEAAKKQYLDHIHTLYPQWCREVEAAAAEQNRRLGASILDAQKRRLLAAERFATQMTMRTEMAAREQELLESAAQGMKEQGQRTRQLQQAQQQADVATASNTSAAAAAAAVLNALVEGTQQQGLRRGGGDPSAQDPSKSGAGELQQGINRLVALLEGSSQQQALRSSDAWDMPPDSPPKRFEPPAVPQFGGHRWGVATTAATSAPPHGGDPMQTKLVPVHPHTEPQGAGSVDSASLKDSASARTSVSLRDSASVKDSVTDSLVSMPGGSGTSKVDGARALIQPDAALQHVNSPGRYAFSSPEGTPVSSLDLDAISRQPCAFPGKSPEASPLGTDYSVTPASSIGMGPRIVPIMRTLSGASSGSELGLAVAPVVPEVLKPMSTADGSGSDIESIRLSRAPALGLRNAETSDSDSEAGEDRVATAPAPVYSWADDSRRSKNSIPLSSMRPQQVIEPDATKPLPKSSARARTRSGSSADMDMQFLGHRRRPTADSSVSIAGEASLITGLLGLDQSPDTSFDDSEAGGTVRSSGGHSGKLRLRQKINLGDSMMSELTEDSALSYSDEDVAAQREAWNRELEIREAAIAQEKAAEENRRQKPGTAAATGGHRPSSTGSSRGPTSPASRTQTPPLGSFGFSAPLGGSSRLSSIVNKALDDSMGSDDDSSGGEFGGAVAPSQVVAPVRMGGSARQSIALETSDEFDF